MNKPPEQEPITPESVAQLLENAQIVIPEDGIYDKLKSAELEGRQLRVKMGFDPTSPDLHLGHAVSMIQLRRFQELGHLPVIIIGDYTGRIGDPTGRNKSRPLVNAEELTRNAETYIDQLGKVLDVSKIEVHRNSEWLEGMNLSDVIELLAQGTLGQVISRDDFRKRLDEGSPIALHEIIYPFLQGMDSVAIDADIEVGGVDQLYAFQTGRTLQYNEGVDPQALILMPLLRGLDGQKKMSKSLGNYIGLSDEPHDMFGKVMSIPDTLLEEYLRLASSLSTSDVGRLIAELAIGANPMEIKLQLAENITATYHGNEGAKKSRDYFHTQFQDRAAEKVYVQAEVSNEIKSVVDLIISLGIVDSKSKARRLIEQGAVKIDDAKINLETDGLDALDGIKLRVGKKYFYQVTGVAANKD